MSATNESDYTELGIPSTAAAHAKPAKLEKPAKPAKAAKPAAAIPGRVVGAGGLVSGKQLQAAIRDAIKVGAPAWNEGNRAYTVQLYTQVLSPTWILTVAFRYFGLETNDFRVLRIVPLCFSNAAYKLGSH